MQKITRLLTVLFVTVLVFGAVMAFSVSANDDVEYFYVNSAKGNDTNSGTSPSDAVKTFTRACNIAKETKKSAAAIVITNQYSIPSTVTEIKHPDVPFIITTKDDTTDYSKTNNAKIIYGSKKRYVLNGDTTFENIDIDYTGSINFVAQYNHITFGEGVTLNALDENPAGIYVVGGWQSAEDSWDVSLDSHITIKSGTFARVIGGPRQWATGSKGNTFTGTHYIEVHGGEIDKLYGGSVEKQYSTASHITVTGGKINELHTAGDVTRRLNGDTTVNLLGGEVGLLNVNNVIGAATVNLKGAKVDSLTVTFASGEISELERKANKDDVLYYDANYYTQAQIDNFGTGFEKVENVTVVYAKSGASGSGASEQDPASFEAAFGKAADSSSVVMVIGSITLDNFTETAHSGTVTVKGGELVLKGEYTLKGTTEFKETKLSGNANINAFDGRFIVSKDTTVGSAFNIVGSAELYAGKFTSITNAKNVYIDGATVDSITGGSDKFACEVVSGNVGTIMTAASSVKDAQISVTGGEIDKIIFANVTNSLTYLLYGGKVNAYDVAGNNVKGTLQIDGALFNAADLGVAASLFEVNDNKVYFLTDGGKGNGTSATSAGGSFADAYAAIGNSDATIVICGTYTIPVAFVAPEHSGKIVITSVYDGVDYRKTNNAEIIIAGNFYCGGETEIDSVVINNQKNYGGLFGAYHKLTIGSDVECKYSGKNITYPSIVGGTYIDVDGVSGEVVINGGIWQRIRLGNSAANAKNADLTLTFNAGRVEEYVILGTNTNHTGNLTFVMNGGEIIQGVFGTAMPTGGDYVYDGSMNIVINGGTIRSKIAPRYTTEGTLKGSYNVTLQGGDFSHLVDIIGTEGISDTMTSTLYVSENIGLDAPLKGTYSFTSLVRDNPNGADPWLFFHDGYYYYTATASGKGTQLVKAANLGDLKTATGVTIFKPEKGQSFSSHLWSPEIHYFSAEEIGEENAGWYCFISCQPDEAYLSEHNIEEQGFGHQRAHVLKCLDGDNLMGRWGNPITGEVGVPEKLKFPNSGHNETEFTGGCSVITINGVKYLTFISEIGRETVGKPDMDFYQTINIVKFDTPWEVAGVPQVICRPEYDWEKGGASSTHPQVVEGATAVYGKEGEVFIIYSGSGYWTTLYQLGQLKYIGGADGDPMNPASWKKSPEPIFSKSDELNGCGHASYVTDTNGQGWICYHAYPGTTTADGRNAYVEPYYVIDGNVVIGNGSKHPAPVDTVYTYGVNPAPLSTKVKGFAKTEKVAATGVKIDMTVNSMTAYVNGVAKTLDAAPVIKNSRTMLPVRFVAENLGATVGWDDATRTVSIERSDVKIEIVIGASTAKINGKEIALDSPAYIEPSNSRTYLPVRVVAENLGATVGWDDTTKTATLVK